MKIVSSLMDWFSRISPEKLSSRAAAGEVAQAQPPAQVATQPVKDKVSFSDAALRLSALPQQERDTGLSVEERQALFQPRQPTEETYGVSLAQLAKKFFGGE